MEDPYKANGYQDREDYLRSLENQYDPDVVRACADLLGPSEDFDGLIATLEDHG